MEGQNTTETTDRKRVPRANAWTLSWTKALFNISHFCVPCYFNLGQSKSHCCKLKSPMYFRIIAPANHHSVHYKQYLGFHLISFFKSFYVSDIFKGQCFVWDSYMHGCHIKIPRILHTPHFNTNITLTAVISACCCKASGRVIVLDHQQVT